jgi:hypothetical protein
VTQLALVSSLSFPPADLRQLAAADKAFVVHLFCNEV